jgi:hypothetical protein
MSTEFYGFPLSVQAPRFVFYLLYCEPDHWNPQRSHQHRKLAVLVVHSFSLTLCVFNPADTEQQPEHLTVEPIRMAAFHGPIAHVIRNAAPLGELRDLNGCLHQARVKILHVQLYRFVTHGSLPSLLRWPPRRLKISSSTCCRAKT